MADKKPWMKFYPADWRSDPRLRMCSLAARGLWLELIALMHEAETYGHLLVGGITPSTRQLSSLVSATERELKEHLAELETAGVFSRTDEGIIYSRRMVRDFAKAQKDTENGKGGGNPKLKGSGTPPVKPSNKSDVKRPVNEGVNPTDNGGDKAQKLEARSQKLEEEVVHPSSEPRDDGGVGGIPPTPNVEDRLPELEALWPHGEGRQHNRVNWTFACGKAEPEAIIAGARAWVAAYDGKGQFLPRLSMWLRDCEWANKPREQSKPGQKPAAKPNRAQVLGTLARLNAAWKPEWTAHYGWAPTATELTDARKAWLTACASGRAIDKSLYGDSPVTDAEREAARRELAKPIDLVAEMPAHLRRKAAAPALEPAAPPTPPTDSFADLWAIWPRRDSQISARATLAAVLDAGTDPSALLASAKAYLAANNSPASLDQFLTTQLSPKPDGAEAA